MGSFCMKYMQLDANKLKHTRAQVLYSMVIPMQYPTFKSYDILLWGYELLCLVR